MDYSTNYSKAKKKLVLRCLSFVIIFILLDNFIGACLQYFSHTTTPDMNSLMWVDFYNQQENSVDVLFIGSSHARFAFNTDIFDEKLNTNSFNLSSSDQTPVVGYYALKEALKYQKPKVVVYEAYWRKFGTDDNTTPAYFIYDYIKHPGVKLSILASLSSDKNFYPFLEEALSKSYKYRISFTVILKDLVKGKLAANQYYNLKNVTGPINYGDYSYEAKGYFSSNLVVSDDTLRNENSFMDVSFSWDDKQLKYFKKTLELCDENNIKVLIVTAPLPLQSILYTKDYQSYSEKISAVAGDYNCEYIDYNLINKEENLFPDDCFMDTNHLNSYGASLFDEILTPKLKEYLGAR